MKSASNSNTVSVSDYPQLWNWIHRFTFACLQRCGYPDTTAAAMGERIQKTTLNISNNKHVDGSGTDNVNDDGPKGCDARHRVALRLLATWLNIKWIKMLNKEHAEEVGKSKNDKLELAGVIGAATLTGGSLIALTGGLAAPAFGHGLGALAPTLGLVPTVE
ncbi:hypothetical protein V6N12_073569 [Hibiscus sabdariffa]|uniref:Uncharacterized protein n=1 Tax=Hibiscus sabdariffa TaxID=183260 RepID=A0ABR2BHG8_9ROSI